MPHAGPHYALLHQCHPCAPPQALPAAAADTGSKAPAPKMVALSHGRGEPASRAAAVTAASLTVATPVQEIIHPWNQSITKP